MDTPRVALCLCGDERAMVKRNNHVHTLLSLVQPLNASTFVLLRSGGAAAVEQIRRVLRPVRLTVAPAKATTTASSSDDGDDGDPCREVPRGSRVCGVAGQGCTHLRYAAQTRAMWQRRAECYRQVQEHERTQATRFTHVILSRPDMESVGAPFQSVPQQLERICLFDTERLLMAHDRCVSDRFAIVPRHLADGYFEETLAFFSRCLELRAAHRAFKPYRGELSRPECGMQLHFMQSGLRWSEKCATGDARGRRTAMMRMSNCSHWHSLRRAEKGLGQDPSCAPYP